MRKNRAVDSGFERRRVWLGEMEEKYINMINIPPI